MIDDLYLIGQFFTNSFTKLWLAFGSWGVIGLGIIAPFILRKIANLVKRIFQF